MVRKSFTHAIFLCLVMAFVSVTGVLLLATPAGAVHKGGVTKNFPSPDGTGGANLNVTLVVDDHDFEDQIRGMAVYSNSGTQDAIVHVSYVKLIKGTQDIRVTSSFVDRIPANQSAAFATLWLNNPSGTFHSRTRMWVCWPEQPGDPCGSAVAWNSNNVSY